MKKQILLTSYSLLLDKISVNSIFEIDIIKNISSFPPKGFSQAVLSEQLDYLQYYPKGYSFSIHNIKEIKKYDVINDWEDILEKVLLDIWENRYNYLPQLKKFTIYNVNEVANIKIDCRFPRFLDNSKNPEYQPFLDDIKQKAEKLIACVNNMTLEELNDFEPYNDKNWL